VGVGGEYKSMCCSNMKTEMLFPNKR
jgi:hypothetical protein